MARPRKQFTVTLSRTYVVMVEAENPHDAAMAAETFVLSPPSQSNPDSGTDQDREAFNYRIGACELVDNNATEVLADD